MTRDEALAYIKAHPAQFKGAAPDLVLAKTRSASDPDYYNPTMYVPEQKPTVVKAAPKPAPKPAAPAPKAPAALAPIPATATGILAKVKETPLPLLLGAALVALGAGMTLYRLTR